MTSVVSNLKNIFRVGDFWSQRIFQNGLLVLNVIPAKSQAFCLFLKSLYMTFFQMHKFHFKKKIRVLFIVSQLSSKANKQQMSQLRLLCTGALFRFLSSRAPCGQESCIRSSDEDLEQYLLGCFCNWSLSSFRAGEGSNCWSASSCREKEPKNTLQLNSNTTVENLLCEYCARPWRVFEGQPEERILPSRRCASVGKPAATTTTIQSDGDFPSDPVTKNLCSSAGGPV